jgi:flagellar motor switch/type III secretory pathway protein FliN
MPRGSGEFLSPARGVGTMVATVAAELGRVTLTIGDVLKLGVGSVLELHRSINEPVDLMVKVARRGGRGR